VAGLDLPWLKMKDLIWKNKEKKAVGLWLKGRAPA
jgi:hypothetical protein